MLVTAQTLKLVPPVLRVTLSDLLAVVRPQRFHVFTSHVTLIDEAGLKAARIGEEASQLEAKLLFHE